MKRRHAAALALVGWYLMIPPRDTVPEVSGKQSLLSFANVIRDDVSLGQAATTWSLDWDVSFSRSWTIVNSYESLSECKSDASGLLNKFVKQEFLAKQVSAVNDTDYRLAMRLGASRCIATDDPRLGTWWQ